MNDGSELCLSNISKHVVLGVLVISLFAPSVHAQSGYCYNTPYGAAKIGAEIKAATPIDPALKQDTPASLLIGKRPLSDLPREIARIRRGYVSGFVSAYPNAEPAKTWFGIDLDRKAAYMVERFTYSASDPKSKAYTLASFGPSSWGRESLSNTIVEIEVVKYLPGNAGETTFGSFVCSANALWASNPMIKRSGFTDALIAYAYIVDVDADGKRSYVKKVTPGGAVYDAVLGIRARMY